MGREHGQSGGGAGATTWTRRDLLIRGGQAVLLAGAAGAAAHHLHDPRGDAGLQPPQAITLKDYFSPVFFSSAAPRISAAYGKAELLGSIDHVRKMVQAAVGGLDAKGLARFISRGNVVLIKPNVGFDRGPLMGATTNPLVVQAVIQLCREAGAGRVLVADNPIENPPACFVKSGIQAAAQAAEATVLIHAGAYDAPVQVRAGTPDPGKYESLGTWPVFWRPLQQADKVIGISPIKDHNLCHASMSMKNWYGLLGGRRNQFHQAIHNIVSDLGFMMRPTLVVVDGTRVMMRNGPTGGRLDDVKVGGVAGNPAVVASVDQLACDSWCVENLLGRQAGAIKYLELAWHKFGQDPTRLVAPHWHVYRDQGKIVSVTV
ncbi:MAG TPA: DUF362 domain-containing protein [Phycisphaerae bacterium]|nr:DUF362 domain-containing protein [Phycisphaerae bacterium]HRY66756.1 DUF362 domain-containing protein [Phycisphaerae bacterium]HSA28396.1 DUF362 domain-containing protein [Phycisphaerae bacterium]